MSRPIAQTVILFTLIALMSACGPATTIVPSATPAAMVVPSATPATTVVLSATPAATWTATVVPPATMTPAIISPSPTFALQVRPSSSNGRLINPDSVPQIELLRTLEGHKARVSGMTFSTDGHLFGSTSLDGIVKVWAPASWQVIREFAVSNAYGWRLFFLADDAHISSGNGTVWDIASGELEHALGGDYRVTFSPDGVWMAAVGREQLNIELWRIADWQLEWETGSDQLGYILALTLSPDNRLLASTYHIYPNETEHPVKLWDVATGQELFTLEGHQGDIHTLAFSPDGKLLASASADTKVKIWDIETGTLLRTLSNVYVVYDVAFSPDGILLAAAGEGAVKLWEVASGRLLRTLPHDDELMAVAFSPDGTLLASGGYDNKIYLWGLSR